MQESAARWQPLGSLERRILGVLVEKAKTTPDAYPLSLVGLRTGCNQKNNREPVMQVEEHQLDGPLDKLRALGAITLVQGSGRVEKYRHLAYEWLGVEKAELAIVTELLLRGPQTEGELRGHASRMDPIADLATLRQLLESLQSKGLVGPLTPPGRGQLWTHFLYPPEEFARIKQRAGALAQTPAQAPRAADDGPAESHAAARLPAPRGDHGLVDHGPVDRGLEDLRATVGELRERLECVESQLQQTQQELQDLRRQLGA